MKNILCLTSMLALFSCGMSEKKRQEYTEKCLRSDSLNSITFSLEGFYKDHLSEATIVEKRPSGDTVVFKVALEKSSHSVPDPHYNGFFPPFSVRSEYQIYARGVLVGTLSNIKKGTIEVHSMTHSLPLCTMVSYQLDGVQFYGEHPIFIKR